MRLEGMTGPEFWHTALPGAIDKILAGVPQALDLPEDFEVQTDIHRTTVRKVLSEMAEDYKVDLQGIEVYGTRVVDGVMKGQARHFNYDKFQTQLERVNTVEEVAAALVKIASFYAPDYGKVGHPCHQWCPVWGRCPDIQKVAITSLIQHFCTAYGAQA